jgi:hypothetical protein
MSQGSGWSPLRVVAGLLDPTTRAPIPVPDESALAYRATLDRLLGEGGFSRGLREAANTAGALLLHGAQQTIACANRLLAPEPSRARSRETFRELLRTLVALSVQTPAAYAIRQAAELLPATPREEFQAVRLPRPKGLMGPLEEILDRLGLSREMEVRNLAALVVHLDDFYDDAAVQVQRIFALAALEETRARALASEFLRRLYDEFARASFDDHLLAHHEGKQGVEPGKGTGLLALLPEVVESLGD